MRVAQRRALLLPTGIAAAGVGGAVLVLEGFRGAGTSLGGAGAGLGGDGAGLGGDGVGLGGDRVGSERAITDLVVALAEAGAGLLLLWLALGAAVQVTAMLRLRRGHAVGPLSRVICAATPPLTRRLVVAALGAGVVSGTALPASALSLDPGWAPIPTVTATTAPAESPQPAQTTGPTQTAEPAGPTRTTEPAEPSVPESLPDPGWEPVRPPEPTAPVEAGLGPLAVTQRERSTADEHVVVRRGDTLWDIAARHLPAGAGDVEIAVEWPRWYAANAGVIGGDPDLILPGMRLVPPTADTGSGS